MSFVRFLSIQNDSQLLLWLAKDSYLSFYGCARLSCERGTVAVQNFQFGCGDKPVECLASVNGAPFVLRAVDCCADKSLEEQASVPDGLNEQEQAVVKSWPRSRGCVLRMERAVAPKHVPSALFDALPNRPSAKKLPLWDGGSVSFVGGGSNWRETLCSEWKAPLNAIMQHKRCAVMVVGNQNVGKSTLCRTLINRALSTTPRSSVQLLDTDIGQGELSAPGILALHSLTEPLLADSTARRRVRRPAELALFAGAVAPNDIPHIVQQQIEALVARALAADNGGQLLIVNTAGWTTGTGRELLRFTAAQFARQTDLPVYVIELGNVATGDTLAHELAQLIGAHVRAHSLPSATLRESCVKPPLQLLASAQRNLRLLQHLCDNNVAQTLARSTRRVSFARLNVWVHNVARDETLVALNGALVALLIDKETHERTNGTLNVLQRQPALAHCVGLAIVRFADADKQEFGIATLLPLETLRKVNTLAVGRMHLPVAVWNQAAAYNGTFGAKSTNHIEAPYTAYETLGKNEAAGATKRRKMLPRLNQQK